MSLSYAAGTMASETGHRRTADPQNWGTLSATDAELLSSRYVKFLDGADIRKADLSDQGRAYVENGVLMIGWETSADEQLTAAAMATCEYNARRSR